jgi:hypothetical protein
MHPHVLAMMARERTSASSVWAAEHGSSTADTEEPEGANPGHRFRIHGRLAQNSDQESDQENNQENDSANSQENQDSPARLLASALDGSQADGERLRELLAQATEIDVADVHIEVGQGTVDLWGTVGDDGERRQLEELVDRFTGTRLVTSRLQTRNP